MFRDTVEKEISLLVTEKERGNAFEDFCKAYFLSVPAYRAKEVYKHDEIPISIRKELGLSGQDIGIDGIIINKDDEVVPYQAKFRKERSNTPSWQELAKFIAASEGMNNRIVITNARNVTKHIVGKARIVTGSDLDELTKEKLEIIQECMIGKPVRKIQKFKPREDQEDAIRMAIEHFKNNTRGQLILPCGTGKTLITMWIAERLGANSILVLEPNLSLVKQTWETWSEQFEREIEPFFLCSDATVDDVAESGLRVSTSAEDVRDFMKKPGIRVVFSTYQSSPVLAEAGASFELGIFDEAHRTAQRGDKLFATANDNANIFVLCRLFTTATQKFFADFVKERAEEEDHILYSMDDVDLYGEVFYKMTFAEAIKLGIISDYRIVIPFVTEAEIKEIIEERKFVLVDGEQWDAYTFAKMVSFLKAVKKYDRNKSITFHNRVSNAIEFVNLATTYAAEKFGLELEGYHINGKMSAGDRRAEMGTFAESPKAMLSASRCLNEGVNIPVIDAAAFIDPKRSNIDIIQAIGRTLRVTEDKKGPSYIIIPVVIPEGDDPNEAIEKTNFEDVWKVLKHLSTVDENLATWINNFKLALGRDRKTANQMLKEVKDKVVHLDIPTNLKTEDFINRIRVETFRCGQHMWKPFEEARGLVRSLKFKDYDEWRRWASSEERSRDIPSSPHTRYKDAGWLSWPDWIGTGPGWDRKYRLFEEAREFAHSLGLESVSEWFKWSKSGERPRDIPAHPAEFYKNDGWVNYGDWLGTYYIHPRNRKYRPFEEAREFVRGLNIASLNEWQLYRKGELPEKGKRPEDIPSGPDHIYRNSGWINWRDWFGITSQPRYGGWRPFKEARKFARNLGLRSAKEWRDYVEHLPEDIPRHPHTVYKNQGWKCWEDWLGIEVRGNWRPFKEARKFVQSLGLKRKDDWYLYKSGKLTNLDELPSDIPKAPALFYKDKGWISWPNWLGTDKKEKEIEPSNEKD